MTISQTFIILGILLVFNAFFSIAEFSIASSRKLKLEHLFQRGEQKAKLVLDLIENPSNFITVIQISLNIIAILSGILGEPAISKGLSLLLNNYLDPEPSRIISMIISVLLITSIFIVFAELVPKKFAFSKPEEIACKIIKPLLTVLNLLKPFVWLLSNAADFILKLFKININRDETMTFEEVSAVITHGAQTGIIEENEHHLIENVLSLTDRNVMSSMTPKKDIRYFDINDSQDIIREKFLQHPHSRFLVCDSSLDNLLGFVDSTNILKNLFKEKPIAFNRENLNEAGLKAILTIPDSLTLLDVLDKFRESRQDIAVIINEFGMVLGLITINDILETLMGNVVSPLDDGQMIVKRADDSWLIDGKVAFEDVKRLFRWEGLPMQDNFETINGFLMYHLKCIPKKAQKFEFKNVIFEVVDVDGYRIDEVMATVKPNENVN